MAEIKSSKNFFTALTGGLLMAIGLMILLTYTFTKIAAPGFFVGWILGTYLLYTKTSSKKKAWGITLITMAIESFLTPIALFIFTVAFVATQTTNGIEAAGGAIGGGIAVMFSAILGGFLGLVFLICGILLIKSAKKEK